jgi:hypothetical protein
LHPPHHSEILALFEDGSPAIVRMTHENGEIIVFGSSIGWDYTNYPGYYELGRMFPFHVRQDEALRDFVGEILLSYGITPHVESSNPHVEVGMWEAESRCVILVINHLQSIETATITLPVSDATWRITEAISGDAINFKQTLDGLCWQVTLNNLQGRAFKVERL